MKEEKPKIQNKYKKPIKKYDLKQKPDKNLSNKNNKKPRKKEKDYKKVDLNKANYADINAIPGITSMMASSIIKLRAEGKKIESLNDLKNLLNISQFQVDQIKEYIIIPNDFNKSKEKNKPTNIKKKKINFNTCKETKLKEIKIFSSDDINKITILGSVQNLTDKILLYYFLY